LAGTGEDWTVGGQFNVQLEFRFVLSEFFKLIAEFGVTLYCLLL